MNWCCQTWIDLGPELADLKNSSLEKLLKRGIPRSTFSPVFRILDGINNFCPLCGNRITTEHHIPSPKNEKTEIVKPTTPQSIKCPPCRGTGKVASGLNCMTCYGTGKIDKSNPHRGRFDGAFAEEQTEKLERTNQKISEIVDKIAKNPQPLREDAKPENL